MFPCRYSSGTEEQPRAPQTPPIRPEFPPPHLNFQPWLPPELAGSVGGDILFVWSFLRSFRCLLDMPAMTVHQLLQALIDGEKSRFLGELHIAMLRIMQADMEEAHATGAMQVSFRPVVCTHSPGDCEARLHQIEAFEAKFFSWQSSNTLQPASRDDQGFTDFEPPQWLLTSGVLLLPPSEYNILRGLAAFKWPSARRRLKVGLQNIGTHRPSLDRKSMPALQATQDFNCLLWRLFIPDVFCRVAAPSISLIEP